MGAQILQDLAVVMVIAAAVTIIFYRLKQPVVLGYLLAGLLVGPHTVRLIHDTASIQGLAELGIILLMFGVGLEFDLRKLRRVGIRATLVAAVQLGFMIWLGWTVGRAMGWSPMDSIFLGAVMSISSTIIIVKILTETGKLKEEYAELAFGVLIIEDIAAIVMVALLSSLGTTGAFDGGIALTTVGAVLLFTFIFLAVGLVLVPRLIDVVSGYHVEEVLVITVVGLAFAAALLAVNMGFSLALGAFLIGAIVAESKAVRRVEHKIVPIRDLFTAMFFVAVGMLIDPRDLLAHAGPILLLAFATIAGKVVSVSLGAFLVGYDGRTAVKTGTTMAQIGEFSFIIAGLGLTLGVVRPDLYPIAVAVCALTSLATPVLMRAGPAVTDRLAPVLPRWYARLLMAYTRGARRFFVAPGDPLGRRDARRSRQGTRVAIYAAWLFGLLMVAAYASRWVGAEVGTALSWSENAQRSAAVWLLGLAALPLFVALAKATEAYVLSAAKAASMNPRHLSRGESFYKQPRVVARAAAGVGSLLLLGLAIRVAWGVHPLAVPNAWLLVPLLMALGIVLVVAWRRFERLYEGMEKTLNDLMGTDGEPPHDNRNERLRERMPWGVDVEEVPVRSFDRASYASLRSLDLRDRTGATVLSLERGNGVVPNPHPEMVLLPGDRIVIVGRHEQLAQARRYLHTPVQRDDPMGEAGLRIPASSPAVGRPLGELGLDDTGARLGLVQRVDGTLVAPGRRVSLEAGDHVVVYGPESSLEQTRARLKVSRLPEAPRPRFGPGR